MASEACRHTVWGVVSPVKLGGKPSTTLTERVTKGWSRLSKQKLYHILDAVSPGPFKTWGSQGARIVLSESGVGPRIGVERSQLSNLAVRTNAFVESFIKVTCRHGLGAVIRQESVYSFGDFKDESSKGGAKLELVKKLHLQKNSWIIN